MERKEKYETNCPLLQALDQTHPPAKIQVEGTWFHLDRTRGFPMYVKARNQNPTIANGNTRTE